MRRVSALVFMLIALLMISPFSGFEQAEATGCNVSIINVDPPSGASVENNINSLSVEVTIGWSVSVPSENLTGVAVYLDKAVWNETKNGWQFFATNIIAYELGNVVPTSPKTVNLGLTPGKTYLLNATITCEYIKNQPHPYTLPELGYYVDYDEKIINYQFKGDSLLHASFTMDPEKPTVNDTITFCSTSTAPNGNIVENKWCLDGQYLQNVGNNSIWSRKLPKGIHTIDLTVTDNLNNSDTTSITFHVTDSTLKNLLLTVATDKTTYITHEKIILTGKLTCDGTPLSCADINLKILQENGKVNTWPGQLTASDGSYRVEYEVPNTPLNAIPPKPEAWTIEVTATPAEAEYSAVSESVSTQIVPVYLKLHSIHLVQVVEAPVIDSKTYIAAGREAGLRVMISCPSLEGFAALKHPEITVVVDIGYDDTNVKHEFQTVAIGPDPTPVDFIFSLTPRTYLIDARVDPYNEFMNTSYSQQLEMSQLFTVKEMKTLKIEYAPICLQLRNSDDLTRFNRFCEQHSTFLRNVYPLPDSKLKFYEVTETINPILLTPTLALQRWLLLKSLSLRSYLTADKVVGVLPADTGWWEPDVEGYSSWSFAPFFYYTRAVLVKYGSNEGVTAHEVGHTIGLNRYPSNEEYTTDPFLAEKLLV